MSVIFVELIFSPGASKSNKEFLLVRLQIASDLSVEPTAVTLVIHAGEATCVEDPEFPLAAITLIPAATALFTEGAITSLSQAVELKLPPKLIVITEILNC